MITTTFDQMWRTFHAWKQYHHAQRAPSLVAFDSSPNTTHSPLQIAHGGQYHRAMTTSTTNKAAMSTRTQSRSLLQDPLPLINSRISRSFTMARLWTSTWKKKKSSQSHVWIKGNRLYPYHQDVYQVRHLMQVLQYMESYVRSQRFP